MGHSPQIFFCRVPQSNGRAEVGVKTAKRILMDNLNKDGSLNNDKVTAALLQYKNTPLSDIGLGPAQISFHRELRDTIPTHRSNYHLHKDWAIAAQEREALFAKRNQVIEISLYSTTLIYLLW